VRKLSSDFYKFYKKTESRIKEINEQEEQLHKEKEELERQLQIRGEKNE